MGRINLLNLINVCRSTLIRYLINKFVKLIRPIVRPYKYKGRSRYRPEFTCSLYLPHLSLSSSSSRIRAIRFFVAYLIFGQSLTNCCSNSCSASQLSISGMSKW